jgi:hypothetical protein
MREATQLFKMCTRYIELRAVGSETGKPIMRRLARSGARPLAELDRL